MIMLLNWLISANLGYIQIRKELSMLPEENTDSQHPHNRHKTHITNNNQNNHRPAAAQRLFAWRISLAESLELRGSARALPCWACRQASSSPWGASSGGNSWCLSLWWDCHHVISRFSMGHNGTFSTCRILGSTLVIKPSSHTENDFGLWFLLIFLAALRCQHCRHKYRCSESAAQEKILWLSTNPNQFIVTLGIWRTLM